MTEKQTKRASWTTISIGIALQLIGYCDAILEVDPNWVACYLLSMPLLLSGYYAGLPFEQQTIKDAIVADAVIERSAMDGGASSASIKNE